MSAHTPGPWWVTESGVRDRGGYIAWVPHPSRYPDQEERYAKEVLERALNARLIAAAPELLRVLQDLDKRLLNCFAGGITAYEAYDSFYQEIVAAAIAKAVQL